MPEALSEAAVFVFFVSREVTQRRVINRGTETDAETEKGK
jgi:hypothetical protein